MVNCASDEGREPDRPSGVGGVELMGSAVERRGAPSRLDSRVRRVRERCCL